jgi:RNA-directed DNA polymerase
LAPSLDFYRAKFDEAKSGMAHTEKRPRMHLMKCHKVNDCAIGEGQFPCVDLYRRYGMYRVPTAAGWKSAHTLA